MPSAVYFRDIIPVKNSIVLWEPAPSWSEMHIWTDVFKLHLRQSTCINSEQACVDLKCIKKGIWRCIKSEEHLNGSRLTLAHEASLSMGFFRQGYWSGLPCTSPGDPPDPGIESGSPALRTDSLLIEPQILINFHPHLFVRPGEHQEY